MKRILFIFSLGVFLLLSHSTKAQVQSNNIVEPFIVGGQNPFFDASAKFDIAGDATPNGKGFVFPRTDLTTWVFAVDQMNGITYPGALDGMIVYNVGEGNTLVNSGSDDNPDISIEVSPGFYYFSNPGSLDLGVNKSITNGKWIRLNDVQTTRIPFGNTLPTITATIPISGEMYYLVNSGLYIFDGTNWGLVIASVADGSITNAKLQGDDDGTLAQGTFGQLLTATGDGQFKWTDAGSLPSGTDTPAQPVAEGTIFYETDTDILWVSDGANWVQLSTGGSTPSGTSFPDPATAGDTFYNTDSHNYYYYNGTTWIPVSTIPSGPDQTSVSNPVSGSTYYNTTNNTIYVYDDGDDADPLTGTWTAVGGSVADGSITNAKLQGDDDGTLTQGTSGQLLTATGDGQFKWTDAGSLPSGINTPAQPVAEGSIFYETDTDILWVSDGANWVQLSTGGSTPSGTSFPDPAAEGDTFYNTDSHNYYYYNGTTWIPVSTIPSGPDQTSVSNPVSGLTYYNTTNNTIYVYDDGDDADPLTGTWTAVGASVADGSITNAKLQGDDDGTLTQGTSGQLLTATGDGQFKWTDAGSLPSGTDTPAQPVAEGTIFYETDTDILWVSDGANWVELQSAGSTLVSGTEPLNPSAGDVYYNTSDNNLYYYNGTDWVMLNGVATGTVTPTDGTGTAGETYYDTTTNTYYVYGSDGTWHAMGDMTKSVYDANNDNIVDVAATVSDNGITNVKIAAGAITDTKLQGTGGGTLVAGQDGQVLTSDGSGTFKWTTVSSAVTGNLYQGTVADVTGFNGLAWATISSATDVGTSIPATICSLDAANYTWIAFPKAWGTQNFFYKYGGSVYAVFDGFEKRIIPAATTGTVDYQVWLFKTTPDIAVDLIVSNN